MRGTATGDEADAARRVALLGPQHQTPTLREVLDEIDAKGPIVLVSAGWEEREAETGSLEEHLGEPLENLGLWPACETAFERDAELRNAMFSRHDRMEELRGIYRLRLASELESLRALLGRVDPSDPGDLYGPAIDLALESLCALDAQHLGRVDALGREVFESICERPVLQDDRARVAETLAGAGTLLIAGGHVGILYNRMRMYGVIEALEPATTVVGWSAGGMVLTERILLFHDTPPHGSGDAELLGPGFGLARSVVALPHASTRLALDDRARVALLSRRMAPADVVALDGGASLVRSGGAWVQGRGARSVGPAGAVGESTGGEASPARVPS